MTEASFKARVVENFSRSALTYDCHAEEQRAGAATLAKCAAECVWQSSRRPSARNRLRHGLFERILGRSLPRATLGVDRSCAGHGRALSAENGRRGRPSRPLLPGFGRGTASKRGTLRLDLRQLCGSLVRRFARWATAATGRTQTRRASCSAPIQGTGSYAEWHRQCARQGVPCSANALPGLASVARVFANRAGRSAPMGASDCTALSDRARFFAPLQRAREPIRRRG